MLTAIKCSDTGLFRHLSNPHFAVYNLRILCAFGKCREKFKKKMAVLDNCIWIGCVTPAFTEREYFSSGVNMLTKCLKIPDNTKAKFF